MQQVNLSMIVFYRLCVFNSAGSWPAVAVASILFCLNVSFVSSNLLCIAKSAVGDAGTREGKRSCSKTTLTKAVKASRTVMGVPGRLFQS